MPSRMPTRMFRKNVRIYCRNGARLIRQDGDRSKVISQSLKKDQSVQTVTLSFAFAGGQEVPQPSSPTELTEMTRTQLPCYHLQRVQPCPKFRHWNAAQSHHETQQISTCSIVRSLGGRLGLPRHVLLKSGALVLTPSYKG